jgi:hypothetical protein
MAIYGKLLCRSLQIRKILPRTRTHNAVVSLTEADSAFAAIEPSYQTIFKIVVSSQKDPADARVAGLAERQTLDSIGCGARRRY